MDVIRRLRKSLDTRKIGHTGTLDPAATGLLPVTVGACTKLAKFISLEPKVYTFDVVFGALTETADDEGEVVATGSSDVSSEAIEAVLPPFLGEIEQRPPRYSAIKVDGKRAYDLARQGVDFELPVRRIQIDALELLTVADGVAQMRVTCGTGTYVRALAVDIAAMLGTVAHARRIRRERVGPWTLADACSLERAAPADLRAPLEMVASLTRVELDTTEVEAIQHGKSLARDVPDGFVALVHDERLVAVADASDGQLQPRRVLVP